MSSEDPCGRCGHARGRHHIEFGCREGDGCGGFVMKYDTSDLEKLKQRLLEEGFHAGYPRVVDIQQMKDEDLRWLHDNGAFPISVSWRDLMRIRSGR